MHATAYMEIDLDALARNYRLVAARAAPSDCGAVVKANAYGLGFGPVSRRLHDDGCRHFFVATLDEGRALRERLASGHIYVFAGVAADEADSFREAGLIPVLNSLEQIGRWAEGGGQAALHLDTGMNRMGLAAADVEALAANPESLDGIEIVCVMTHLACADEPDHALNREQLIRFDEWRSELPDAPTSIGNSAGTLFGRASCGDLARPGIALYGGNPFASEPSPVESVVTVKARVLQIRQLFQQATVGYGASFTADAGTRIAVVGMGYADGYPRSLGNCGFAVVAGHRVPIIGRVSMDFLCLDVSRVPASEIEEGGFVTLLGGEVPIDELAALAGTISYELLTGLGQRLERIYREKG